MSTDEAASLGDDIKNITKATSKLQRMLEKIGTRGDDSAFRATLQRERDEAQRLCRKVISKLKRAPPSDKSVLGKLSGQFKEALTAFDRVCEEIEQKQKNAVSLSVSSRQSSILGSQAQSQAQSGDIQFMPYAVDELEQRKKDIQQIERDVLEVREIFADLNRLVTEQQVSIDIIDNHVSMGKANVEKGHEELVQAEYYQTQARKKKCCILLIVLIILLFVGLMAGLLSKKK